MLFTVVLLVGCGGSGALEDAGVTDAGPGDASVDAGLGDGAIDASHDGGECCDAGDAAVGDASADAGPSCLDEGHAAGDRVPVGDDCNFCECGADGATTCTARTCPAEGPGCTYDGVEHGYGERFAATDGCNECVCAASGLACTRRCSGLAEEGAILLESMNESCGDNDAFTGHAVIAGLPVSDLRAPFDYDAARALYPETRADTEVRFRIVYDGGFVVCRLPSPDQPAIDVEVVLEWITADGAFDEGLHAYLRRNDFGFVDAWLVVASAPVGGLDGTYSPGCLDPNGFSFSAEIEPDGTARGRVSKACETDIGLDVGTFERTP